MRRGGESPQTEELGVVATVEKLLELPCMTCPSLNRCYEASALECSKLTLFLSRDP